MLTHSQSLSRLKDVYAEPTPPTHGQRERRHEKDATNARCFDGSVRGINALECLERSNSNSDASGDLIDDLADVLVILVVNAIAGNLIGTVSPPGRTGETALYDVEEMRVFEGGCDSFFIVELLIDCILALMCTWTYANVDFEAVRKSAQETDAEGEADEGGHAAVWDGGRKLEEDMGELVGGGGIGVGNGDVRCIDDGELFKGEWMFRVGDRADEVVNLLTINALVRSCDGNIGLAAMAGKLGLG